MVVFLFGCQIILAVVLLLASVGKMFYYQQFSTTLRQSRFSEKLIKPLSLLVPLLEFCLAFGLITMVSRTLVLILLLVLIMFCTFTVWVFIIYHQGIKIKCSCFGTGDSNVGPKTIIRNILLIAISLIGLSLAYHVDHPFLDASLWLDITEVCCSMSILLFWAFHQARHGLNFTLTQHNLKISKPANTLQMQKKGGR